MGGSFLNLIVLTVIILGVGALALGMLLLWRWKRATRVGLHPTCRGCGFDLSGLQITQSSPPMPCPECGIALIDTNIAMGDPRRSPFTLFMAIGCLVASLGIFALGARRVWPTLTSALPTAVLVVQSGIDRADGIGTITELAGRMGTKRMTAAQAGTLIDRALDQQKNSLVWTPAWGLIVENAHDAALTTDAQWKQYIETAATPFVDASSKVAAGDPLTIDVGIRNCRVSSRWQGMPAVGFKVVALIDDVQITGPQLGGGSFSLSPGGAAWSTYTGDTGRVPAGNRTLRINVTASIRDKMDDYDKPPKHTFLYALQQPITVLSRGTATHAMTSDAALTEAMRQAIDVQQFDLEDGYEAGAVRASHMVHFKGLPRGVAMEMVLRVPRQDGTRVERVVGKVAREAQPAGATHGVGGGADIKDPQPLIDALRDNGGVADLILRPNLDVARTRPNLYEIWGEEIVIPSQKVRIKLKDRAVETPAAK